MAVGRVRIWGGFSALVVAAAALAAVFSVDSALAQEDRGTERARAAGQPPCNKVIPLVPNQFPAWSNGAGWDDPSYYSTIQLADVDGDGNAELLARGPGGISTSRFDVDTGAWQVLDTTGPFTDEQGWADPSLYRTIQLADIDGQPGAEMIGRAHGSVWTIKWDNATNSWNGVGQRGLMSDSEGWGDPSGYSTIQLADIDGQPGAELVGRRPGPAPTGGMYEYKWNGRSWQQIGFDDTNSDQNGWGTPDHYSTIQLADIDGQPGAELIGRGDEGMEARKWGGSGWTGGFASSPIFTNDQGGSSPDRYLTIQTADVDGDHRAELLGRYPDDSGIKVFDWGANGWEAESELQGFQSADAWNQPEYYRTIQTADIDGDGQAELLYRDASGLKTSHYDKTGKVWSQPQGPAIPAFSDDDGFNLAQSYLTIQAADVAGGKRAEVLARSFQGIETLRTNTPAPAIDPDFQPTIEPGFTDYSEDPKLLAAYQWIGQNAFSRLRSTSDVRSHYDDLLWADYWLIGGGQLQTMLDAGQTPVGLDPVAFKTVATQLETEFSYVADLNTWSGLLKDLYEQIFVTQIFETVLVPTDMSLPTDGNNTATVLEILELITEFVSDISGLGGEEGEVVGLVASLVSTSMETAVDTLPGPPSIDTTVAQLQTELLNQGQSTQDAAGCVQKAFAQSWALLKALGKPIDDGQVEWTDTQTAAMVAAAQRGYELVLWQTLTPAKPWQVLDQTDISHLQGCNYSNTPPTPYPQDSSGNSYLWQLPNEPAGEVPGLAFFIQDGNCGEAPPEAALSRLFNPPNPDGTGSLGVPKADVHCGVNGWRIPGSGIVNTTCPPPWGTGPPALSSSQSATARGPSLRAAAMRRGTRLAGRQISALRSSVRAQVQQPRARLPLLRTLRQAASLTARARRTGIPTYAHMAESTLQGFVGKAKAHAGRGVSFRLVRRHTAHAHAIRGLLLGARGGRPPRARIAGAKVKVNDSGAGEIRVRCARGAAGPCRGMLRLVRGERVLTRARFRLRPGGARRVGFQLRRSTALALARRGRLNLKAQATTRHMSGRRATDSRRIQLTG